MATAVLTSVPTTITLFESITGLSGDTFSLEPDIKVQGGNSVSCAMTNNGVNNIAYNTSFPATNQHLRLWANFTFVGNIDTKANNGIQISVVSGSGTSLYTVDGAGLGEYAGGWKQFVVYTGNAPTSGSIPSGTCTSVGFQVNTTSKPRNQPANAYFDAWYYGDGYTVTGGTSGDEIDWSHVAALDKTEAYGIIDRVDDVYFFAGDIKVGNGATTTFFKSGQKVQFKDLNVSTTLYGINFQGSACNIDISGGAIGAAGTQDYLFDASDPNLGAFNLTGVQFEKANNVKFKGGQSITNTLFSSCGLVEQNGATLDAITITNGTGLHHSSVTDFTLFTNINLISGGSGHGILADLIANFNLQDVKITGYGLDDTANAAIDYQETTPIQVSYTGQKPTVNPTSLVTVLDAQVSLVFTIKNSTTGAPIQGARIEVRLSSDKSQYISPLETDSLGVATVTVSYIEDLNIEGWVRQMDLSGNDYTPKNYNGTISLSGYTTTILLEPI